MKKYNIRVTDYNTIVSNNPKLNEITTNEFIKKINKSKNTSIKIIKDEKIILIRIYDMEYELKLKKEEFESFLNNDYSNLPNSLQHFFKFIKKYEMIEDAKNGNIDTKESRDAYLEYLNRELKFSFKDYLEDLKYDLRFSFNKAIDFCKSLGGIYCDKEVHLICLCVFTFVFGLFFAFPLYLENIINLLSAFLIGTSYITITSIPFVFSFLIRYFKERGLTIFDYLKEHKLLKNKIKSLEKIEFKVKENEKSKDSSSYLSDKRFLISASFKTDFYKRISDLITKINSLDNKNQKEVATRLQELLMEFKDNKDDLENIDPNSTFLVLNDKVRVEQDILFKLESLEKLVISLTEKNERILEDDKQIELLNSSLDDIIKGKVKTFGSKK
ncbi:MAG: hypothetical protein IJ501_02910 [Bacilli bacterium]|nr:hypothetical protein [Bacilli bacterium]